MDVIQLKRKVWCYRESGEDVIAAWLREIEATAAEMGQLSALIDLYECAGERSIGQYIMDIGDGLYSLKCLQKGGHDLAPIFCKGPSSDLEITFLAGALQRQKTLRPYSAKGEAMENLEKLKADLAKRKLWTI